jgi:hypothetical protein
MYWLITYKQYTRWSEQEPKYMNLALEHISPVDWLIAIRKKHTDIRTVLVNSVEITAKQAQELNELL